MSGSKGKNDDDDDDDKDNSGKGVLSGGIDTMSSSKGAIWQDVWLHG